MGFDEVGSRPSFPSLELEVAQRWKAEDVFRRSVQAREGSPRFVFYEGPPTANGRPGLHHVVARCFKDLWPRYKTMRGFLCERRGGWDTHGLPVELEVEKELGISGKEQIEEFGIANFNQRCRESVHRYISDWQRMTERMGMWLDMEDPYETLRADYIESVWWALSEIHKQGLLYRGFKVVPYCPRCQTSLSSHEVSLGYRDDIKDPWATVRMRRQDDPTESFLAWTTTPWTLPANLALAVGPDIEYVRVRREGETLVLARERVEATLGTEPGEVSPPFKGSELIGARYQPLYAHPEAGDNAYQVLAGDFVNTQEGTGIVHVAPAYGEDDLSLGQQYGLPVIHTVERDGTVNAAFAVEGARGVFVKKADFAILKDLEQRGLLFAHGSLRHTYPFCWRCETPLLYYALTSWFIRTTALRDTLLENNLRTNWVPDHLRTGRMGNWLETLVDWNLSRTRYWGTPLPVWICEACEEMRVLGSRAEANIDPTADLHRPGIDAITLPCECGGVMRRVPEVIDTWFDSGSMPFAQFHYPFENKEEFWLNYPADFIAEGVDQTRGWFYSLLAIGTLLTGRSAYKAVVVHGLLVDEQGRKMSKSRGNTLDPTATFDEFGADTVRWFFYSSVNIGGDYRIGPGALREVARKFLLILWNTYSFFVTYARLDGFKPDGTAPAAADRPLLDRWLLHRLDEVIEEVTSALEAWDATRASRTIQEFVDELSTWYVRRSRSRFWRGLKGDAEDSACAYQTLYEALTTLALLLAPFTPFTAEMLWQNLAVKGGLAGAAESVHLSSWPEPDPTRRDPELSRLMSQARQVVEALHAARDEARLKVRQPLAGATVELPEGGEWPEGLGALVRDELNLKSLTLSRGKALRVELDTTITPELREEGLARDLVRQLNDMRKRAGLRVEDRILLWLESGELQPMLEKWEEFLKQEVLALELSWEPPAIAEGTHHEVLKLAGAEVRAWLRAADAE